MDGWIDELTFVKQSAWKLIFKQQNHICMCFAGYGVDVITRWHNCTSMCQNTAAKHNG